MTYSADDISQINQAEFHIPASDSKGHSERLWVRVQPSLERQIDTVINTHNFPYKTKGDFLRHAIHRHLIWLGTIAPFPTNMRQIEAIDDILKEEEFHAEFEDIYRRLQNQVSAYVGAGDLNHAKSLVVRVRARLEGMPEGEWKKKYLKTMDEKFGHLLMGQPLSLMEMEE